MFVGSETLEENQILVASDPEAVTLPLADFDTAAKQLAASAIIVVAELAKQDLCCYAEVHLTGPSSQGYWISSIITIALFAFIVIVKDTPFAVATGAKLMRAALGSCWPVLDWPGCLERPWPFKFSSPKYLD